MQMLLESSFIFLHATVDKETTQRASRHCGEDGATRTAIKSLRGGRGGRQRVFAASSLGGAAREQYAAMEAGGGAKAAPPPKKGAAQRPASRRPSRQKIGPELLGTIFFICFFFSILFPPSKGGFFPKRGPRAADPNTSP
jgi:hypothetical protein